MRQAKSYNMAAEHAGVGYCPSGTNVELFKKIDACLELSPKATWCWILSKDHKTLNFVGAALIVTKQISVTFGPGALTKIG